MASGEVTAVVPGQNEDTTGAVPPQVGLLVTADVRVVQYRSSDSLGTCGDTNCTIVTSLSAIINESLIRSLGSHHGFKSKECIGGTMKSLPVISKEACDHPLIRRSKKHTQLNSLNLSESTAARRAQIDRTVLLPYFGCTRRFEPFQTRDDHLLARSSKSWETVGKPNKAKDLKPFRSLTCNNEGSANNISSELNCLDYQNLVTNEQPIYPPGEYDLPSTGFNLSNVAVRSFYLIKTPISGDKIFSSNNKSFLKKAYNIGGQNCTSANPAAPYLNKNELHKNITGFDGEVFGPQTKLNFKTTRNVSILHRPKTRDKSTSTTSLDGRQDLDKSIQGLLMPYTSMGRDFPSEVILKLIPKAEALKNSLNESTDQSNRSKNSSEVNLLAPTLNIETKPKKKSKSSRNSLWNFCFSNKKNKNTGDADSGDTPDTELYYPSIVEVHNNKSKVHNSEGDDSVSSFYNVDKKSKRL